MKIVVENLSEGEVIPYPVLLVKGRVENLDPDALKGQLLLIVKSIEMKDSNLRKEWGNFFWKDGLRTYVDGLPEDIFRQVFEPNFFSIIEFVEERMNQI